MEIIIKDNVKNLKCFGIYAIVNRINNKIYIGSSNNVERRLKQHYYQLNTKYHPNKHLQRSWNKYNKTDFEFIFLKQCTLETQLIIEQECIDTYKKIFSLYNILQVTGNCSGYKHTENTKKRIGNASKGVKRTEETLKKMSEWQLGKPKLSQRGRKLSPEHIEKIRKANTGYRHSELSKELNRQAHLGNKHTEEAKRKISEFQIGKIIPEETRRKISEAKKGTIVSEETRQKLREYNLALNKTMSKVNKEALRKANKGNTYNTGRIQTEKEKLQRSISAKLFHENKRKQKQITLLTEEIMIPSCILEYNTYPILAQCQA